MPSQDENVEEIIKGGHCCLKDDVENPTRIWNVKHYGDKFATLETHDTKGLKPEEMVRVVDLNNICSIEQAQRFSNELQLAKEPSNTTTSMPPIIIAPKFFNGNGSDNSIGGLDTTSNQPVASNEQIITEVPYIEPTISFKSDTLAENSAQSEPTSIIDFSKGLKITKEE